MNDDPNKRLRAAVHRLLCNTKEQPGGVFVKDNFVRALDRALDAADAADPDRERNKNNRDWLDAQGIVGYSRVAGRPLIPVPPAVLETEDES